MVGLTGFRGGRIVREQIKIAEIIDSTNLIGWNIRIVTPARYGKSNQCHGSDFATQMGRARTPMMVAWKTLFQRGRMNASEHMRAVATGWTQVLMNRSASA